MFAGAATEPDSADCRYGAMVSLVARDKMTLDEQKNLETQNAPAAATDRAEAAAAGAQNWVAALPATEYPSVVALADYLLAPDVDERFQFGIEILRNGLETRLERQGGNGPAK